MHRRQVVKGALTGAALGAAGALPRAVGAAGLAEPAAADEREYYELRTYELRNDLGPERSRAYFQQHLVPALRRAGSGPVGCFAPDIGMAQPALVLLVTWPTLAAMTAGADRLAADAAFGAATRAWEKESGPAYVRYDVALYRAFAGHPRVESAAAGAPGGGRIFELRTYEAPNATGLRSKIEMFDTEEIRIFRQAGFSPVWFGEAVAGPRLPHLTYMVAFPDLDARGKAWGAFGSSPDWQRIRVRPGWTDPETVSSIRASFLRATGFSEIR